MDMLVTSLIIASSNGVCYDSINRVLVLPSKLLLVKVMGIEGKDKWQLYDLSYNCAWILELEIALGEGEW